MLLCFIVVYICCVIDVAVCVPMDLFVLACYLLLLFAVFLCGYGCVVSVVCASFCYIDIYTCVVCVSSLFLFLLCWLRVCTLCCLRVLGLLVCCV